MDTTIHQPNFFPRLKILQKIASSDLWVILDNVQFADHEWQNRTKIVPINGNQKEFWLTLPIICPNGKVTKIKDVVRANNEIADKTRKALQSAYSKAPYWGQLENFMEKIYPVFESVSLTEIDTKITVELLKLAGKNPRMIYSSQLPVTGKASQLVANLCNYLQADTYLCDSGGYRYLDTSCFTTTNILWQKWVEPISKWDGIDSWRDISCLNYLVREGIEKFATHLNAGDFKIESNFY